MNTSPNQDVMASGLTADEFWASTPTLRQLHDYAVNRMVNPTAVLMAVVTRAAATIPPDVMVGHRDDPDPLNIFTALVGASGCGKRTTLQVAYDVVPSMREGTACRAVVESLELIPFYFIQCRNDRTSKTGFRVSLDTIYQLVDLLTVNPPMGRTGGKIVAMLCDAWSGRPLGAEPARNGHWGRVPRNAYRLCVSVRTYPIVTPKLASIQGIERLTARFLWAPMGLTERPWKRDYPAPHVDIAKTISEPQREAWEKLYEHDDCSGITPRLIHLPAQLEQTLWDMRCRAARRSHDTEHDPTIDRIRLTMRVAAVLACIENNGLPKDLQVSEETWRRACWVMERSDEALDQILKILC